MGNQETRGMHFVPETYLGKFGNFNKKGEIKVAFLDKSNYVKIKFTTPANLCKKRDMYRMEGETLEERQCVEEFYYKFTEENCNRVFELLTNDSCQKISNEDHQKIILFVITLLFRTQKLISTHNEFLIESFTKAKSIAEQIGLDYFRYGDSIIHFKDKSIEYLVMEYGKKHNHKRVAVQLKAALNLYNHRKEDAISIIKIEGKDFSYLTSDNPVSFSNNSSQFSAYFDVESEMSLTINSQYKLTIYPKNFISNRYWFSKRSYSGEIARRETEATNLEQYYNAERFIIGKHEKTLKETSLFLNNIKNQIPSPRGEGWGGASC